MHTVTGHRELDTNINTHTPSLVPHFSGRFSLEFSIFAQLYVWVRKSVVFSLYFLIFFFTCVAASWISTLVRFSVVKGNEGISRVCTLARSPHNWRLVFKTKPAKAKAKSKQNAELNSQIVGSGRHSPSSFSATFSQSVRFKRIWMRFERNNIVWDSFVWFQIPYYFTNSRRSWRATNVWFYFILTSHLFIYSSQICFGVCLHQRHRWKPLLRSFLTGVIKASEL